MTVQELPGTPDHDAYPVVHRADPVSGDVGGHAGGFRVAEDTWRANPPATKTLAAVARESGNRDRSSGHRAHGPVLRLDRVGQGSRMSAKRGYCRAVRRPASLAQSGRHRAGGPVALDSRHNRVLAAGR